MLSVFMLNGVMLHGVILSVVMLSVAMLNGVMLSVVMLNIVAPFTKPLELSEGLSTLRAQTYSFKVLQLQQQREQVIHKFLRILHNQKNIINKRSTFKISQFLFLLGSTVFQGANVIKLFTAVSYDFS